MSSNPRTTTTACRSFPSYPDCQVRVADHLQCWFVLLLGVPEVPKWSRCEAEVLKRAARFALSCPWEKKTSNRSWLITCSKHKWIKICQWLRELKENAEVFKMWWSSLRFLRSSKFVSSWLFLHEMQRVTSSRQRTSRCCKQESTLVLWNIGFVGLATLYIRIDKKKKKIKRK